MKSRKRSVSLLRPRSDLEGEPLNKQEVFTRFFQIVTFLGLLFVTIPVTITKEEGLYPGSRRHRINDPTQAARAPMVWHPGM